MKYHFKIFHESDGFTAQCIELPGCITEADTVQDLEQNMKEALNLYIEEPESSRDLAALPDDSIVDEPDIVKVSPDPQIAFAFLLRYNRIKHGLTQQELAKKMGFENVYSYQRLEESSANPTLTTLLKILNVFPDFSFDYALN